MPDCSYGQWIFSVEDFLNNSQAQDNAQYTYKVKQWQYIKGFAQPYDGITINIFQ